ncbi:MAG TPA: ATP-binding cassette domain-containing protein [Gemmatimonadaceae bacterium]|nr:ATP-binding cassette domain-containing protein [Gemmatimonadaceae bacterium]
MAFRGGANGAVTPAPAVLELEGIDRRFGSVRALAGASLRVRPGTVHALLGENGAGKTTLMRIAFGLVHADAGTIRVAGAPVRFASPRDAIDAGIGMVQQHFSLVPAMTVAENLALGGRGLYAPAAARERVERLARETGLPAIDPDAVVGDLPVGAQQRVEILKALARDARLLILDEPTAVLAPAETAALLRWARGFASGERAVVLITHKLADALGIADDVTVLRHGHVALSAPAASLSAGSLAEAMLGEPTGTTVPEARPATGRGDVVARASGIAVPGREGDAVAGVTLEVRGGEILGVAAVEGNGERELLRALAGRAAPSSGTLELPERIAFIPQDRHADGVVDEMSLTENVALEGAGKRGGRIDWSALRTATQELMRRFDVRAAGPDAPASSLSGGNQQRLVLARELAFEPALVVADQPTRGLDIRATADVHARLRAARARGGAVVVYSTDLDEVLSLADRVIVVSGGRVHEVPMDREAVGRAMLGVA